MHILLINPNRYHFPPVIPLGLEYLAGSLERTGHKCTVLDLCFSQDPRKEIADSILKNKPELAGLSVRQIDTVLYRNNQFFLDQVREYVHLVQQHGLQVVLGGSGYSIMPQAILEYTGADRGVVGPGDWALPALLDDLEKGRAAKKILNGYDMPKGFSFARKKAVDYQPYLAKEGIVGFRTQAGCAENCFFCVEHRKKLLFHRAEDVGKEVASLKDMGFTDFHLADSEFNQRLGHCLSVCRAIVKYAGKINWSLYMKPVPFSKELFAWLKKSGAGSLTLSLDTYFMKRVSRSRLEDFFHLAVHHGLKVAVDLSLGAPGESLDETKAAVDFLAGQPAATVGVNAFYRVYPGTPLFKMILKNKALTGNLINFTSYNELLFPVFFNRLSEETLKEIIGGRPQFRIEGFDQASNYQRIKSGH
jgi:radical SAM superfamily enzyme YgiQ (UPF0313 family)